LPRPLHGGNFLRCNHYEVVAAQILWGVWLFPMGVLTYQSGFLPRFIGVWLILNGAAYVALCLTGIVFPAYEDKVFLYAQPALFGELVIMLWLLMPTLRRLPRHRFAQSRRPKDLLARAGYLEVAGDRRLTLARGPCGSSSSSRRHLLRHRRTGHDRVHQPPAPVYAPSPGSVRIRSAYGLRQQEQWIGR
jgi:hypothetical protein